MLTTMLVALARSTDRPWVAMRLAEAAVLQRSSDRALLASLIKVVGRAHGEGRHQSVVTVLNPALSMAGVSAEVRTGLRSRIAMTTKATCGV